MEKVREFTRGVPSITWNVIIAIENHHIYLSLFCDICIGIIVDDEDPNHAFSSLLSERERTIKEQVKLQTQKVRHRKELIRDMIQRTGLKRTYN